MAHASLILVRDGVDATIARFDYGDDAEYLFNRYKAENKYHVKLIVHGFFGGNEVEQEHIPTL